jgi:hypothetical protein
LLKMRSMPPLVSILKHSHKSCVFRSDILFQIRKWTKISGSARLSELRAENLWASNYVPRPSSAGLRFSGERE